MEEPSEKVEQQLEAHFSVECPALNAEVPLLKSTWFGHILNRTTGHPYMASKTDLIKRAVKSIISTKQFFRLGSYPKSEWFADYACCDFEPTNKALRIAFKKLDSGTIIIASTYKVPQGVFSYEP